MVHRPQPSPSPAVEELMERGIYGLGGFLSVAQELRVLWSTPYLSRLWPLDEMLSAVLGGVFKGNASATQALIIM